jgi:hypothetical protein
MLPRIHRQRLVSADPRPTEIANEHQAIRGIKRHLILDVATGAGQTR